MKEFTFVLANKHEVHAPKNLKAPKIHIPGDFIAEPNSLSRSNRAQFRFSECCVSLKNHNGDKGDVHSTILGIVFRLCGDKLKAH